MMYYLGGTHYFEYDIREVLELMISEGVDVNRVSNSVYRATALNRAVDTKNREAVKILLDLGADVNIVGVSDNSSLLSALLDFKGGEDEKEIIRMLLDAGADLEATNLEEQYPEQLIAQYAHEAKNGQRGEDFNLLPILTKMGVQITATANDPEPETTDVRMFYWDIESGRSVPGSEAVVCSLEEALKTFDSIATIDGAFFGIVFPDEKTLQFMYDKTGQLYIEIPMPEQGGAMQKTAPKTEVLEMIKTVFENQDPTSVKGLTFEKW
ncbi:MAG: hypothetical protein MI810_04625 [Flavobacteriales bacterium]|nr:hypothetical protein [Flavobacteriales bacterium]